MNYLESIKFIESFANLDQPLVGIKSDDVMSPNMMKEFLNSIGYSSKLSGLIHITGTKGKGSTAAFIASALNNIKGPASLFICPHLVSYTERFSQGIKPISKTDFAQVVSLVKSKIESSNQSSGVKIAQFYIIICAFLEWSNTISANWNIVEVGLGGKNDPTNALTNKQVAVFTPIHKEHSEFLGNTISDITHNKAGIISEGCKVIVSQQENMEVVEILKSEAKKKECEFIYVPDHYSLENLSIESNRQIITIASSQGTSKARLSMLGKHQAINSITAMAVVNSLGIKITDKERTLISDSFEQTKLPGRFEVLDSSPLTILDGAHTKDSAKLLWSSVSEYCSYQKAIVVLAIGQDKEAKPLVMELCKNASIIIATKTNHSKAMAPSKLMNIAKSVLNKPIYMKASIKEALAYAKELSSAKDLILITGSLHTTIVKDLLPSRKSS